MTPRKCQMVVKVKEQRNNKDLKNIAKKKKHEKLKRKDNINLKG